MPGRNDPCPCGSGKKFKKCCGRNVPKAAVSSEIADLPGAIACFENGNYTVAVSMAEAFLKQHPKESVAWQVLGVSRYFLGDMPGAEQAFNNLLKYDKRNPDALNNLGLVLYEQGRLEQAEDYCKQALKINPNMPGAHNNLGNIYRAQMEFEKAEASYRKAITQGMQNPEIWCNLGTVLQEQTQNEKAREAYKQALSLDENFVAALCNLGGLYFTELELDKAFEYLQRAYRLAPDDTEVLNALGNYYFETDELEKAENCFLKACEIQPDSAEVNYRLGFYYQQRKEFHKAKGYLERAVQLQPDHAKSLIALGEIMNLWNLSRAADQHFSKAMEYGGEDPLIVHSYCGYLLKRMRHTEVLPIWQRLQEKSPDNPTVLLGMAEYYTHITDFDQADTYYRKLIEICPDEADYYSFWAEMNESRHHLDDAADLARHATEIAPGHIHALTVLANIYIRQKKYYEALALFEKINSFKPDKDRLTQTSALFEWVGLLDKLGEFDKAYELLVKANKQKSTLIGKTHDHDKEEKYIHNLKEVYKKELPCLQIKHEGYQEVENLAPIFIVGFPRSGTTLLEQILASHSKVSAGDELVFIDEVKNRVSLETGSKKPYPQCMEDEIRPLTESALARLRHYYIERVIEQGIVEDGSTMFTDKMPHNLMHLGLISCVFPAAPIIHITRHPMDACLSALMANFNRGHLYTASITDTARHYKRLMDLVEHYKSQLEMNYLQIRYEDLVDSTELNTRKVIEFVGLQWEDACLKFNESKRVAKTASYAQVTQKIYTSSRYRYKNYYKHLAPYEPILHDAIHRFGYTFEP